MAKIPFTVSARTARLIGRENVSSVDGAIIELVKNTYDADARFCIIYFDNKYNSAPEKLSVDDFNKFNNEIDSNLLETSYKYIDEQFILKELDEEQLLALNKYFKKKNKVYIIDNGEGMTEEIIKKYWMTIGTSNKENNYKSENGRVRTGAKGIGRFALDRLGDKCRMITLPENNSYAYRWDVDWRDFEKDGATINKVYADINLIDTDKFFSKIENIISVYRQVSEILKDDIFYKGTILEISELRDSWTDYFVNKMYSDLEMLIPPIETLDKDDKFFDIYLLSSLHSRKYGKVTSSISDDYDYKLEADIKNNGKVKIKINRNEFEVDSIPQKFFQRKKMLKPPYDRNTFDKGYYTKELDISKLLPNYEKEHNINIFEELGPFNFQFYFIKKFYTNENKKKYFYKDFNKSTRSKWLKKFGGIKLFRDKFRVRPYGEKDGAAFDWLMLGDRVSKSPAAPSHKSGSWRVRPNQVYGVINVSRITNVNFEDKSSREGLQENIAFNLLRHLILKLIHQFEKDRQYIIRELNNFHEENDIKEQDKKKAKKLATQIVSKLNNKSSSKKSNNKKNTKKTKRKFKNIEKENEILAKTLLDIEKEKENLLNELQLLRSLASTGLVITSFAHELKNLSAHILPRTSGLKEILEKLIDKESLKNIPDFDNPFIMIKDFREQDKRLKSWLDFSLNSIKKDKRRRKKYDLYNVFKEVKRNWESALSYQSVKLTIPKRNNDKFLFRVFLIDIDSIFNNLIANSLDAFKRNEATEKREITIKMFEKHNRLNILYEDTGPGLSRDIEDPNEIFDPLFTTKRDIMGKEIGTGLGMWIVKSTVDEYRGYIEVLNKDTSGFKLKISCPLRKDEGVERL